MEKVPTEELNRLLMHFFHKIKKPNGEDYEPETLTSYQRSFDRHLRNGGQVRSILTDHEFSGAREALKARRKQLKQRGKGCKLRAAEPLTFDEEEKLWTAGQLGQHSPHALLQTVWFYNTMHFGWRGCDEHRRACYGDFRFGRDKGQEYVEFCTERGTKTRTGAESGESLRAFNPRMYATGTERCPVSIFKNYIQKRPQQACKPDSPLYLSVANSVTNDSATWYKNQLVGKVTLGKFMKSMAERAGLEGRKTNHSARKTMISRLVEKNINPLHVAQLSGHKNLKSLDSYSKASTEQQRCMSHIVSGTTIQQSCSTTETSGTSVLPGMTINGETVNIFFNQISSQSASTCISTQPKKRRVVLYSSDEED